MPSLQIRDLPEDIYEALRFRAASEHRSLTQQALADLTQVVKSRQTDTRKKLLASIRQEISNKAPVEDNMLLGLQVVALFATYVA